MRDSCLNCGRKHLAKAEVLMSEARLGYPDHRWLAIGNMSEAEDELVTDYPGLAMTIREHRKAYEDDPDYIVPSLRLIRLLTDEEMRGEGLRGADQKG